MSWSHAGNFFKHTDKPAVGAESQIVGYINRGVIGIFKHIACCFDALISYVLRNCHPHLFFEQITDVGGIVSAVRCNVFEGYFIMQIVMNIVRAF